MLTVGLKLGDVEGPAVAGVDWQVVAPNEVDSLLTNSPPVALDTPSTVTSYEPDP